MSDPIVRVPAIDLAAVVPFRAHQDVRYYLDGVFVEPVPEGGCMIVATEGHMLAAIHSLAACADQPRVLRIEEGLENALRDNPEANHDREIVVSDEKGRVTLHEHGTETFIQVGPPFIDGRYPDWRKPIPPVEHLKPGAPAALQALYLARLWKTCRDRRHTGIFFSHDDRNPDNGCSVVQVVNRPGLIICIMAMKFDRQEWPTWMPREPANTEVAA